MRFCQGTVAFLLAAAAATSSVTAAISPQNSLSSPFLPQSKHNSRGIFGVPKHPTLSIATSIVPRGGAVAEDITDEDESEAEEAPATLYLPGLLNASVLQKKVRIEHFEDLFPNLREF